MKSASLGASLKSGIGSNLISHLHTERRFGSCRIRDKVFGSDGSVDQQNLLSSSPPNGSWFGWAGLSGPRACDVM